MILLYYLVVYLQHIQKTMLCTHKTDLISIEQRVCTDVTFPPEHTPSVTLTGKISCYMDI